jgi:GrpB-like predicted nucleotidyltransferase (UPF0157 family)
MPILLTVVPHRESWKCDFEREALQVESAIAPTLLAFHHIGSTAIPGIHAKPIIDILAEVDSLEALDARQVEMERLGYEVMGEFGIPGRRYFRKGNAEGLRTHQIHAFAAGSPHLVRHLAFRDYLRACPSVAQEYSDLKVRLVEACHGDLEAYMDGKDPFIKQTERDALAWWANREDAVSSSPQ